MEIAIPVFSPIPFSILKKKKKKKFVLLFPGAKNVYDGV